MSERDKLVARLRGINLPTTHNAAFQIERDGREIGRLRLALRIIAGHEQCLDNLMSNADIARAALNGEGETAQPISGSSKWGPGFPPAGCTAWEDCVSDGVCHDSNCGAPSQHGEGET